MNSPDPLISIVTVVYNAVDSIEKTMLSVLEQTYSNVEYIIIDGGSKDGTLDVIKKYDARINHWISEKDNGIYHAMNKGIELANGELIGILNADDQYFPNTLELVAKRYSNESVDIIHGNLLKLRKIEGKEYYKPLVPNFLMMEHSMGVLHPTCFIKKSIYHQHGKYDESFKLSSDYDFILRLYKAGCSFSYINESLAIFQLGGASSNELKSRWEKFLILRKHQTGNHVKELYRIGRALLVNGSKSFLYQMGFGKLIDNRVKKKWS